MLWSGPTIVSAPPHLPLHTPPWHLNNKVAWLWEANFNFSLEVHVFYIQCPVQFLLLLLILQMGGRQIIWVLTGGKIKQSRNLRGFPVTSVANHNIELRTKQLVHNTVVIIIPGTWLEFGWRGKNSYFFLPDQQGFQREMEMGHFTRRLCISNKWQSFKGAAIWAP